ncbi:MAG: YfhO family protein [Vicinamibacteria bacterium]
MNRTVESGSILRTPLIELSETAHGLFVCVIALSALLLALFPRVILLGEVFYERDVLIVWTAQITSFVTAIRQGSWPVWDPGVAFGHPMLGNPNTQVFYPFTWLNLLIEPLTVYALYVMAHLLFTGIGVHLWAKRLGASSGAATLSACLWVSSGPLLSFVNVWHHLAGACWMPWAMWAADFVFKEGRRLHVLRLSCILAIQIYAGSPDMCVFTGLVLGLDALRRVQFQPRAWAPPLRLVGAYALAVGLGAAQLLPSLDLVRDSGSRPLPVESRTVWSMHPAALIQTVLPVSFAGLPPIAPKTVQPLFDLWSPFMKSNYVGLAAALLAALGLVAADRRLKIFLGLLLGLSIAVALGRYSVIYTWLVALAPPLGMVRYPSKAIVVMALVSAVLAGLGYDAWLSGRRRLQVGLAAGVVLIAACASVNAAGQPLFPGSLHLPAEGPAWSTILSMARTNVTVGALAALLASLVFAFGDSSRRSVALLLPLILVVDLVLINRQINPSASAALLNQRPEILKHMPTGHAGRIYAWDYAMRVPGHGHPTTGMLGVFAEVAALPDPRAGSLAFQAYLYPPIAPRFGLRGSFDRDLLGLYPRWFNDMNLLLRTVEDTPSYVQLLQLAGVDRVIALHRDIDALRLRGEIAGIFRLPIQIFDVPDPWPRTYVTCATRVERGPQPIEGLLAPDFQPNLEVMVDRAVELARPCRQGISHIVEDTSDRIVIDVDTDGDGVVALLEGAAKGWQALVDGRDADILRVNYVFRGAQVPAGRHRLTFVYRPESVKLGVMISILTMIATALAGTTPSRIR